MPSYPPVSEGASAAVRRQLRWTGDGCVRSPLLTPARTTRTPEQAVTPQRAQLWIIRVHFNKKNKTTTATITASGCVLSVGTRLKGTILLILFGKPRDIHACGQITWCQGWGCLIKLNPSFSLESFTFFLYISSIAKVPTFPLPRVEIYFKGFWFFSRSGLRRRVDRAFHISHFSVPLSGGCLAAGGSSSILKHSGDYTVHQQPLGPRISHQIDVWQNN